MITQLKRNKKIRFIPFNKCALLHSRLSRSGSWWGILAAGYMSLCISVVLITHVDTYDTFLLKVKGQFDCCISERHSSAMLAHRLCLFTYYDVFSWLCFGHDDTELFIT